MRFTDRSIAALKRNGGRYEIWEDGRTNLGVRVGARKKSWQFMYRFNGRARRMTLGDYPSVTLAEARARVAEAKRDMEQGIDPGIAHVTEVRARREAPTVEELIELYLEKYARPRKRSAAEDARILWKDVAPTLRGMKISAVTRGDVNAILDKIIARGAGVQANRTLAVMRKMFNFALSRGLASSNPCEGVPMPARERPRDRVLTDKEIAAFWSGLEQAGISETLQLMLKLLLVTGQRKMEVASAEWGEFDLDDQIWVVPAHKAKNGRANRVPLSPLALRLLHRLRELHPGSICVFPSIRSNKGAMRPTAPERALNRCRDAFSMPHFTPHDLRRTAATGITQLGHGRLVVEKILNHADRSVAAIYDTYAYDDEKRDALYDWAQNLENIIRS